MFRILLTKSGILYTYDNNNLVGYYYVLSRSVQIDLLVSLKCVYTKVFINLDMVYLIDVFVLINEYPPIN